MSTKRPENPSSNRRKSGVVLAIGAIALVAAGGVLVRKMRERREFVSKTVMGYRCRFTYPGNRRVQYQQLMAPRGPLDVYNFVPAPSPIRDWIALHLFHETPSASGSLSNTDSQPSFMMETAAFQVVSNQFAIQTGYPESTLFSNATPGFVGRLLPGRHLHIDGCPATVFRCEVASSGQTFYGTILLVYQPETDTLFNVEGAGGGQYRGQMDRELEAIISSFHIEHVKNAALSADAKR